VVKFSRIQPALRSETFHLRFGTVLWYPSAKL